MTIFLSASGIKDFLSCNRKYYYRRFFSKEAEPTTAMHIGTIVHATIEKKWYDVSEAKEFAELEATKRSIVGNDLEKVKDCVSRYFEYFHHLTAGNTWRERFFNVELTKGVRVRGVFDTVVDSNMLIDWKTTTRPPRSINNDIQFILYDWAFEKVYGRRPGSNLYASLTTGKLIRYSEDKDSVNILFNEVIPYMVRMIEEEEYPRTGMLQYYSQCKWCSFKGKCFDELASGDNNKR